MKFFVIGEDGCQVGGGFDCVLKAIEHLRAAEPYSFLVREDGAILSRRLPPIGASAKRMQRAETRYELRRVGRSARVADGMVH